MRYVLAPPSRMSRISGTLPVLHQGVFRAPVAFVAHLLKNRCPSSDPTFLSTVPPVADFNILTSTAVPFFRNICRNCLP